MRFAKNYLLVISAITMTIGVLAVFWPSFITLLFFTWSTPESDFFTRMLGSTLIGYSTLNYLASRDGRKHVLEIAVIANFVTLLVASLAIITASLELIQQNQTLVIAEHGLFTLGFGYAWYSLDKDK